MKILWLTTVPSQYRVDFFNMLGQNSELMVFFEKRRNSERSGNICSGQFKYFKYEFLKSISITNNMALAFSIIEKINATRDSIIIVHNPASPTGILAVAHMKRRHIPFYIESDGGIPRDGKGMKEFFKGLIYKGATGYFTSSELGKRHLMRYGAKEGRIRLYPFTSIWESDVLKAPIADGEKRIIRKKLGIYQKNMVVSVGQFIRRKGFDILIKASELLNDEDIAFVFIGGIPSDELLKSVNGKNLYFIDFLNKSELNQYYEAADVFVLPTRYDIWGLVVNEAMAKGLPIISTTTCVAATELVRQNQNGFLYEAENYHALAEILRKVLDDEEFRKMASAISLQIIRNYTIEQMATAHIEYLEDI